MCVCVCVKVHNNPNTSYCWLEDGWLVAGLCSEKNWSKKVRGRYALMRAGVAGCKVRPTTNKATGPQHVW